MVYFGLETFSKFWGGFIDYSGFEEQMLRSTQEL